MIIDHVSRITNLTAGIPSLIAALLYVKKHYEAIIDWRSSTEILAAFALSGLATHVLLSQLSLPSWIELIIGAAAFLKAYITIAPPIGAINKTDIQNIKEEKWKFSLLKPLWSYKPKRSTICLCI